MNRPESSGLGAGCRMAGSRCKCGDRGRICWKLVRTPDTEDVRRGLGLGLRTRAHWLDARPAIRLRAVRFLCRI